MSQSESLQNPTPLQEAPQKPFPKAQIVIGYLTSIAGTLMALYEFKIGSSGQKVFSPVLLALLTALGIALGARNDWDLSGQDIKGTSAVFKNSPWWSIIFGAISAYLGSKEPSVDMYWSLIAAITAVFGNSFKYLFKK